MDKRKQIDNISTAHARSIVLRFLPRQWNNEKFQDEKTMRTYARNYCRKVGKTPKQLIETPLPR